MYLGTVTITVKYFFQRRTSVPTTHWETLFIHIGIHQADSEQVLLLQVVTKISFNPYSWRDFRWEMGSCVIGTRSSSFLTTGSGLAF